MRLSMIMWAALTVVVGVSLFLLKYQVQALEDQLHATHAQIEKDKSAIRVLQAEWTYLNDPARLRRLSEQHLGFGAPNAKQVATLAQLPYRDGRMPIPEGASAPMPPGTSPGLAPKQIPGARTAMLTPASAPMTRLQSFLGPSFLNSAWSAKTLFQEPQR
jgi:cell division protein FtsL